MKGALIINNVRLEIGHEILNMLSYSLDDNKKTMDIAHELAQSPCCETRSHIASRRCLHKKTVTKLMLDTQIEVMRAMIENDIFLSRMMLVDVERFIDADDPEVLAAIVNAMTDLTETYEVCERDWLCEQLFQHPDPCVRFKLADSKATPVFFLGKLAKDSDLDVSQAAIEILENMELGDDVVF
jgi:hypothetical protein